jgi:hypothetical protein
MSAAERELLAARAVMQVCVCVRVCLYVFVHACVSVCMHVCMCLRAFALGLYVSSCT